MKTVTLNDFYEEIKQHIPEEISKEIGHFNVFNYEEMPEQFNAKSVMPYNRRTYYKISFIMGRNRAEYADKVVQIDKAALVFATPRIPYHWIRQDDDQSGFFCVFTEDFLLSAKTGGRLDDLPIFKPGNLPIFNINEEQAGALRHIFQKMTRELSSDYAFKYDLIRNYVLELIHFGQKLQPLSPLHPTHSATARITSLFVELLERQFPIENQGQKLQLRTAKDYAARLSVHVNHLNKVLKETTGSTTTGIINNRILQEAKILLKQTNWSVSEIAYSLGFEEIAHFSNFFRKQTQLSPLAFRS